MIYQLDVLQCLCMGRSIYWSEMVWLSAGSSIYSFIIIYLPIHLFIQPSIYLQYLYLSMYRSLCCSYLSQRNSSNFNFIWINSNSFSKFGFFLGMMKNHLHFFHHPLGIREQKQVPRFLVPKAPTTSFVAATVGTQKKCAQIQLNKYTTQ
jgi:hypothetical protein